MNPDELKNKNEEIEKLGAKIKELEVTLVQSKQELDSANESIKAKDEEVSVSKSKIDELVKANTELSEQINKAKAAELKANRVTKLVDGGIARDNAEKKVELFAALSDEQFDAIADELITAAKAILEASKPKEEAAEKPCDKEDKDEDEKDSKGEENAENQTLEKPEESVDANLTVGTDTVTDQELDTVRNELAEAIASVLIKTKVKK